MAKNAEQRPSAKKDRALALLNAGKWAEASAVLTDLVQAQPFDATLRYNLAYALQEAGNTSDAVTHYLATISLDGKHVSALNNFGNLLVNIGRSGDALKAFRRALEVEPDHVNANKMAGLILLNTGATADAVTHLGHAVQLAPTDVEALLFLAQAQTKQNRFSEAIRLYDDILAVQSTHWVAHNNTAGILKRQGMIDEALVHWQRALVANPDEHIVLSNMILASHYTPNVDAETRLEYALRWGRTFGAPVQEIQAPPAGALDPDRPIRVGYISSDFRGHPVGYFMIGVFKNHDRENVEVFAYSATTKEDTLTESFQAEDCTWRDIANRSDASVAELIREDGIDILVDLAGHTEGNRLRVLARKPAPIQVVGGGYMCTTGLDAVDYAITDAVHSPPGSDHEFTETLIRLADGYVSYSPPGDAPDVGPLPARDNVHVTFGCLNNLAKLGPNVIELWAKLLHRVPSARLLLASKSFDAAETRDRFEALFRDQDIDPERITFEGGGSHHEYLGLYNRIDIALDPFPYSGGLTTCEALWMGVPVITLGGGGSFASRHSSGHLSRVGFDDLIAGSPEAYVGIAENLAGDLSELGDMRAGLRDRMAASPLCDGAAHTRALEAAFRDAWQAWCRT